MNLSPTLLYLVYGVSIGLLALLLFARFFRSLSKKKSSHFILLCWVAYLFSTGGCLFLPLQYHALERFSVASFFLLTFGTIGFFTMNFLWYQDWKRKKKGE